LQQYITIVYMSHKLHS